MCAWSILHMTAKECIELYRKRDDPLIEMFDCFIVPNFTQKLAYYEIHADLKIFGSVDDCLR